MNIRAYKVIFPDGTNTFESKTKDARGAGGYTSIKSLAESINYKVVDYFKANGFVQVSIDFSPFHDMEYPSDLQPKFCVALSDEEKWKFWEHYNKASE